MNTYNSNLTDDQLIVEYCEKGNNKAFDVLFARYHQLLFNTIFYKIKNSEIAEDIFQDTLVKAISSLKQGKYAPTGKFRYWLLRIANNLVIDFYRQSKYEYAISEMEYNALDESQLLEQNIEDHLVNQHNIATLQNLIFSLPKIQQEIVIMRFYKNMSFKEIAEEANIGINTALGRMRYALCNLKKIVPENKINIELIS